MPQPPVVIPRLSGKHPHGQTSMSVIPFLSGLPVPTHPLHAGWQAVEGQRIPAGAEGEPGLHPGRIRQHADRRACQIPPGPQGNWFPNGLHHARIHKHTHQLHIIPVGRGWIHPQSPAHKYRLGFHPWRSEQSAAPGWVGLPDPHPGRCGKNPQYPGFLTGFPRQSPGKVCHPDVSVHQLQHTG